MGQEGYNTCSLGFSWKLPVLDVTDIFRDKSCPQASSRRCGTISYWEPYSDWTDFGNDLWAIAISLCILAAGIAEVASVHSFFLSDMRKKKLPLDFVTWSIAVSELDSSRQMDTGVGPCR